MDTPRNPFRTPWWFTILLLVAAIPALTLSGEASRLLDSSSWGEGGIAAWLYPAYVVISAICAWYCYGRRRALAWILFALIVLTDCGLYFTLCQ